MRSLMTWSILLTISSVANAGGDEGHLRPRPEAQVNQDVIKMFTCYNDRSPVEQSPDPLADRVNPMEIAPCRINNERWQTAFWSQGSQLAKLAELTNKYSESYWEFAQSKQKARFFKDIGKCNQTRSNEQSRTDSVESEQPALLDQFFYQKWSVIFEARSILETLRLTKYLKAPWYKANDWDQIFANLATDLPVMLTKDRDFSCYNPSEPHRFN